MTKNKKIFYGALGVAVVLIGVYFLLLNDCQQCRVSYFWSMGYCDRICLPMPTQPVSTTTDETAGLPSEVLTEEGWKTYRNEEWGFAIDYPSVGWGLKEYEGGFSLYKESLKEKDAELAVMKGEGIAGMVIVFDLSCVNFDWKWSEEVLENVDYYRCGLPLRTTSGGRVITTIFGQKGRTDRDAGIPYGNEVVGPAGFAVFPLKMSPAQKEQPVLLLFYIQSLEIGDEIFEQIISTFKFID